jgi:thiosulfate dehydrogenase
MSKWNVQNASWFVGGVLFALVLLFGGGWAYLATWNLPVAVADRSLPMEAQIVDVPLDARIDREKQAPPFAPNQSVYEAGASVYQEHCASCHGTPTKDVESAKWMYRKRVV